MVGAEVQRGQVSSFYFCLSQLPWVGTNSPEAVSQPASHYMLVILKLDRVSEPPGGLVKAECWLHPQSLIPRAGVEPKNLCS